MATAPKMPRDEAVEILRRTEPALGKLDERLRKIETDVARLDGRLTELSSKTPTIWQIVAAVLGINARIMAIGFGMAKVLAP